LPFIIAGLSILAQKKGETAARIGGMVVSLMQLHYSREDEYQADQLGEKFAYKSGYDPSGMVSFFQKLESEDHTGNLSKLDVSLMSHPKTTNRIAKIEAVPELSPTNTAALVRIGDSYRER
jgi:predicted Zn-dependent protease